MNDEQLDKMMKRLERARKIFCPHCGEEYDDEENQCISYHGTENELWEIECPNLDCERTFYAKEIVDRTYETVKCTNCEDEGSFFKTVENDSGKLETTKVPCKCIKITEER